MGGNIIRLKRLDIDNKPPAVFQHSDAFPENAEQHIIIGVPTGGVIMRVVFQSEIIGGRGKDDIDAVIRELLQILKTVGTNDFILEFGGQRVILFGKVVIIRVIVLAAVLLLGLAVGNLTFGIISGKMPLASPDPVAADFIDDFKRRLL